MSEKFLADKKKEKFNPCIKMNRIIENPCSSNENHFVSYPLGVKAKEMSEKKKREEKIVSLRMKR